MTAADARQIPRPGLVPLPPPTGVVVPTRAECQVRVDRVSVRRRGPRQWRSPERVDQAARLLHGMLIAAAAEGVSLSDCDAEGDLPGLCFDIVVGKELRAEARG